MVVHDCCVVLAKLVEARGEWLVRYAPRMIQVLFEVIRLNVEIMSNSANAVATLFIRKCTDKKGQILEKLIEALKTKYDKCRVAAIEYVIIQIEKTDENESVGKNFWQQVGKGIQRCIKDANEQVRALGLKALCMCEVRGRRYEKLLTSLRGVQLTKYNQIKEQVIENYSNEKPAGSRVREVKAQVKRNPSDRKLLSSKPDSPKHRSKDKKADAAQKVRARKVPPRVDIPATLPRVRSANPGKMSMVQVENERLKVENLTLKKTIRTITDQNTLLAQQKAEIFGAYESLQQDLDDVHGILDKFEEMSREQEQNAIQIEQLKSQLQKAVDMIEERESIILQQKQENVELAEMCEVLFERVEQGDKEEPENNKPIEQLLEAPPDSPATKAQIPKADSSASLSSVKKAPSRKRLRTLSMSLDAEMKKQGREDILSTLRKMSEAVPPPGKHPVHQSLPSLNESQENLLIAEDANRVRSSSMSTKQIRHRITKSRSSFLDIIDRQKKEETRMKNVKDRALDVLFSRQGLSSHNLKSSGSFDLMSDEDSAGEITFDTPTAAKEKSEHTWE